MNKLIHGDCLEVMQDLIDQGVKVDAVICDPPFGTTKCKWDTIIPLDQMWLKIENLCAVNTPKLIFGQDPFSSHLRISNINQYRYDWIWEKDKGANWMFANKQPMKVHELVSVFYKNQPIYNPQKTLNPKGTSKRHLSKNPSKITANVREVMGDSWKETKMDDIQNYHGKNYEPDKLLPRSIQYFARESRGKVHPTQKPVALMEYLIKTYTNEGDVVLDFAMGSGTTCLAAKNLNRQYIGIEKEKEYFDIAVKRLND